MRIDTAMTKAFMRHLLWAGLCGIVLAVSSGSASSQPPPRTCEEEVGPLRWLVQKYASERTTLEFALATSEAKRQAAEARLKALEEALKFAPKGQNPK